MADWTRKYFGDLYHEIYSKHLLEPERAVAEAAFAAQVLDLGRRKVLDLACGFGRHARLLASSNKVVALDNNGSYLGKMRENLKERARNNLFPVQGDMRHLPLADRSVDAAIMLFNSFGYFDANADEMENTQAQGGVKQQVWKLPSVFYERQLVDESFGKFRDPDTSDIKSKGKASSATIDVADSNFQGVPGENLLVLAETRRVLKPGGGLLLEIPNRDLLLEAVEENPKRLMVMDNCEVHEQFEWDAARSRLRNTTRFVSGDREESAGYSIRLYDPAELKTLITDAGFRIRRTFGDYEGGRFGRRSSDVLLVYASRRVREKKPAI